MSANLMRTIIPVLGAQLNLIYVFLPPTAHLGAFSNHDNVFLDSVSSSTQEGSLGDP